MVLTNSSFKGWGEAPGKSLTKWSIHIIGECLRWVYIRLEQDNIISTTSNKIQLFVCCNMIGKSIYMLNLTENYIFYLHPQLLVQMRILKFRCEFHWHWWTMLCTWCCVFCPSVWGLLSILDVCQAYAESHGIIFNCSKTVSMTFKALGVQKAQSPHCWHWVVTM